MAIRDLPKARADRNDPALSEDVADAAAALRTGELVVFPTETFYAIGADPMQPNALAAILRLKGRERDKPIALIAADAVSAFAIAREIPAGARLLAETFWPGALTVVLPARQGLNEALIGPNGGIGVRVSPHPTAHALAAAIGGLITATSANLSGEPPARTLIQAREALGARISIYLDGGTLSSDAPSTVVEFDGDGCFHILRAGVISRDAIAAAVRGPK
ncbi:MAG: threonylcarbamoyl-AMP synthase [Deltaproteobacteria bacterium]|nr:threonylcarbamoyl-AMP synthase [Deltaproteobacteria bacterium]